MKWLGGIAVLVVLALVGLLVALGSRVKPVEVAQAKVQSLSRSLDEDGLVRSQIEVNLACQAGGRLAQIYVKNGQRVSQGQLLAELENGEQKAALEQLQAQERGSLAALQAARQQVQLQTGRSRAELQVAQAGVQLARAQANQLLTSPRQEQREVLLAAERRAHIRWKEAERDFRRRQELFREGAVSRSDLESYESAQRNALYSWQEVRARWQEGQRGPIPSERRAALAEVDRSRANLQLSSAQQGQIEISAWQAQEAGEHYQSLRSQVEQAQEKLRQTRIYSPRAGVVEWDEIQPGEVVTPGQLVLRLIDPKQIYIELLLDEADRAQARLKTPVKITCDAHPGKEFAGQLDFIESQAFLKREVRNSPTQDEDRVFRSRVSLTPEALGQLYPGMSVFAQVILEERTSVLTVPRSACVNREGEWVIYREIGGRAQRRVVEIGQRDNVSVEVLKGLQEGDWVVLNPGTLADGARLRRL